ncbi:sigma-70 family RNA polymerase sigma factor [Microvirga tunisiensis]|uniref:RNA polymerase sigma factor n=2 Tax=Microvirga tunisiensis TaxID=2108360 RepID=A0A5N7MS10_9HYPH|nr:sigma-70 family RNA polymerase sigma factor [Microvirga tunisiensis]MPR29782.1 sigma-70 family RNA polymerase sigma factor [Microvirga tunisiensis]
MERASAGSIVRPIGSAKMTTPSITVDELRAALPSLRAFAMSLCGNRDHADDLVQDTLVRAWSKMDRFEAGTNLNAWLCTILRNIFYSDYRKSVREVEDADGSYAGRLFSIPDQEARLALEDFQRALMTLSADQREALLLVTVEGFSYEEAAEICGCVLGTVKSRVNRARTRLADLLSFESEDDLGPGKIILAALPIAAEPALQSAR